MVDDARRRHAEAWLAKQTSEMYIQLDLLLREDMGLALNTREDHGLNEAELIEVMMPLFRDGMLVASRRDRGCFTPTEQELRLALHAKSGDPEETWFAAVFDLPYEDPADDVP